MHLQTLSKAEYADCAAGINHLNQPFSLSIKSALETLSQSSEDSLTPRFRNSLSSRTIKRNRAHTPTHGAWLRRTSQSAFKRSTLERLDLAASHTQIKKYLCTWLQENVQDRTIRVMIKKRINKFLKTSEQTRLDLNFPELKLLPDIFHLNVFKSRLRSLSLESTQIATLPLSICSLKALEKLLLSNTLIKALPPEIRFLTSLRMLCISYTPIEQLPLEIGRLLNLNTLNCTGTSLQQLPDEIGFLKTLRTLYLDETLIAQLPPSICELKNLKTLSLTSVPLVELPEDVGDLNQLESLYVNFTQIKKLPAGICRLEKLHTFSLDSTPLTTQHPEIQEWTAQQIIERNGYFYLPHDAYTIRGDTLFVKVERNTVALFARENLHLLASCLRQEHPEDRNLRLLVKYDQELVLDEGGPSREFISTLLHYVIDQEKKNKGDKCLFQKIEEENELHQISYSYGSMSLRDTVLCEDIGTLLSALTHGFTQGHDCKIGMLFSKNFYQHVLSLCTQGASLLDRDDEEWTQQEKEYACSILASQDPAYFYYRCGTNITEWGEKSLRKLLEYLIGDFILTCEDYQDKPYLAHILENAMQPGAIDVEWVNLQAAAHDPKIHRLLSEKIAVSCYDQYAHIYQPLLAVAGAFKRGHGDRAPSIASLLNNLPNAARKLSYIVQGSPFTRNACLALMDRSICLEEVRPQFDWIKESIADEVHGATEKQIKDMLACITGAAVITDQLQLHFTVYGKRVTHVFQDANGEIFEDFEDPHHDQEANMHLNTVCYFHTCSKTVELPRSMLELDKRSFLTNWYEVVAVKNGYTHDQ